jgi:GntR family transcriptional regulator / MocR family aminotransferase
MANSEPSEWATSGVDLFLDFRHGSGLRGQIEEGLRDAIRSRRLPQGARLPASRALARDLGVSRGTVLAAYTQLVAEGWIAGHPGSATVVAAESGGWASDDLMRPPREARWRFDLRPGRPDPSSFPRTEWLRALRRALAAAPDRALGYGDTGGRFTLRSELAAYLRRARGLRVTPDNVVVTTGFTQSLNLVALALARTGVTRVAIEEPSMPEHRAIVRAAGHEVVPLTVDGSGARVETLAGHDDVGAVVLTPNRQHPLGVALSARRRAWLLDWARRSGALVVEDDYDGEFRYDTHPIGPLQGLEPGVVAYAGTASKTLAPGLRLGWLAAPRGFLEPLLEEKRLREGQAGVLEQLALAEFLQSGAYDRHVRKMRLRYRHRRDVLLQALGSGPPGLRVAGTAAGLNLLVHLPDAATEQSVLAAARSRGIGIEGLLGGDYYEGDGSAGLIVGYAAPPEHAFAAAVEAIASVLRAVVE